MKDFLSLQTDIEESVNVLEEKFLQYQIIDLYQEILETEWTLLFTNLEDWKVLSLEISSPDKDDANSIDNFPFKACLLQKLKQSLDKTWKLAF